MHAPAPSVFLKPPDLGLKLQLHVGSSHLSHHVTSWPMSSLLKRGRAAPSTPWTREDMSEAGPVLRGVGGQRGSSIWEGKDQKSRSAPELTFLSADSESGVGAPRAQDRPGDNPVRRAGLAASVAVRAG